LEVPLIDELLDTDEKNIQSIRKYFAHVSPTLPKLLNDIATLYKTCARVFSQELSRYCSTSQPEELKALALVTEGLLLGRIGVLYCMAAADFLRMRITAPFAKIRLQCESLALIKLMEQSPDIAQKWQEIRTEDDGKKFFNKYQGKIKNHP
jgi:hypothetical protein